MCSHLQQIYSLIERYSALKLSPFSDLGTTCEFSLIVRDNLDMKTDISVSKSLCEKHGRDLEKPKTLWKTPAEI